MEEMKNLVIQTLETKGVLGQIRAKLRSAVFKVVDDQDQRSNPPMGCGLKWENPLLYKIKETNVGGVISELIREFMEYLKMDYSLSVFIPECSISPERLKKEEIMAKLGMSINNFNSDLPIIFFIIHHFIESLQSNPQSVYDSLNKIATSDVEKYSDDTIIRNLYNYQTSNFNENEEVLNNQKNNMMEDKKSNNDVYGEEEWSNREQVVINNGNDNNVDDNVSVKKQKNDFEKLNDSEIGNPIRRSFEFEDVNYLFDYIFLEKNFCFR
jgi:lisH domain-containing protein FOPNL